MDKSEALEQYTKDKFQTLKELQESLRKTSSGTASKQWTCHLAGMGGTMNKLLGRAFGCAGNIGLVLALLNVGLPYAGYAAVAAFSVQILFLIGAIKVEIVSTDGEHSLCCASVGPASICPCQHATQSA